LSRCDRRFPSKRGIDEYCLVVTIQFILMNIHLHIDPHSGVPVYRQIIDQVKYYVASGIIKADEQLPSVRELAQKLSINPTTVVKAYTELEHERIIEILHGKGAFVARATTPFSESDKEKVVRRLARQLAVESMQVGASFETVERVLGEEWDQLGSIEPLRAAK
jgi:GntR family transcriptional regulator